METLNGIYLGNGRCSQNFRFEAGKPHGFPHPVFGIQHVTIVILTSPLWMTIVTF